MVGFSYSVLVVIVRNQSAASATYDVNYIKFLSKNFYDTFEFIFSKYSSQRDKYGGVIFYQWK